jgi:hypothetical protein
MYLFGGCPCNSEVVTDSLITNKPEEPLKVTWKLIQLTQEMGIEDAAYMRICLCRVWDASSGDGDDNGQ